MDLHRRRLNGHAASPDTPASYYYDDGDVQPPAPEDVDAKLKRVGSVGEVADRVADMIAQEATERRQMIGGVDNFWLLLSDITDFNPVRMCLRSASIAYDVVAHLRIGVHVRVHPS